MLLSDTLTGHVIGLAIEVHRHTGPGLLKSVYEQRRCVELRRAGTAFARHVPMPMRYKGEPAGEVSRRTWSWQTQVIREITSATTIFSVHKVQLRSHLRMSGIRAGLLLNFNAPRLMDGLRRYVVPGAVDKMRRVVVSGQSGSTHRLPRQAVRRSAPPPGLRHTSASDRRGTEGCRPVQASNAVRRPSVSEVHPRYRDSADSGIAIPPRKQTFMPWQCPSTHLPGPSIIPAPPRQRAARRVRRGIRTVTFMLPAPRIRRSAPAPLGPAPFTPVACSSGMRPIRRLTDLARQAAVIMPSAAVRIAPPIRPPAGHRPQRRQHG